MTGPAAATLKKSGTKKVTFAVGQTKTLKVKTGKPMQWSSSRESVATVSKKGVVRARKAGTATIRAKVGSSTYKCKVTVKKNSWTYPGEILNYAGWEKITAGSLSNKGVLAQPYSLKYNSKGKLTATFVVANFSDHPYTLKEISSVLIRNKSKNGTALAAGAMSLPPARLKKTEDGPPSTLHSAAAPPSASLI